MTDVAMGAAAERPTISPDPKSSDHRLLVVLFVVTGLIFGFAIAYLVFRPPAGPSNFDGAPSVQTFGLPATGARPASPVTALAPAVIDEPRSARAALDQFLTAEAAMKPEVSFSLLDPESREKFGSVASWQSSRADRLLPEAFTIQREKAVAGGVDVVITATRTPAVSPLTGLVPAQSEETWRVVNDGGWRVVRGRPAEVRPVLPDDSIASRTGAAWLERAAACDKAGTRALQLSPNLLGSPTLAGATCKAKGEWTAGAAVPVSELPNSTVFVSAYGPGVGRWARAVPVTGKGRYTIVLAPLGDEWRVVGVIPEGSPRP